MNSRAMQTLLGLALVFLLLPSGCLTRTAPEKQRHVLSAPRTPDVAMADTSRELQERQSAGVLQVHRVRSAPLFERKGFVYRQGETEFVDDFYNEFYSPPASLIRQSTLEWLDGSTLFTAVVGDASRGESDWLLEGTLHRLYVDMRDRRAPETLLELEYTLLSVQPQHYEVVFSKRYERRSQLSKASGALAAQAWSESLVSILSELEGDLQEQTAP